MDGEVVEHRRLVLAVDGGNSKTDVALVTEDGEVLATGRAGAFAPQSDGVAAALDVVEEAVRQALARMPSDGAPGRDRSIAPGRFDHVAAYLAGADLPVEEEALALEFARRGFGPDISVRNDTFAVLRAGASGPWGVAVVCGAGINAVGVSPTGEVTRFPALGHLSGDWGGGQGIAEEALWHAARAEDGRGPATALTELCTRHFAVRTVEELILEIHFGRLEESRLHELTPGVFATAAAGDPIARSLVERQAEEITVLAEVCLRRLDLLETPTEVVLGGGILQARDPLLTALLDASFAARAPRAKILVADVPPIVGAALNGLEHLGATDLAKTRLRARYERA
ncbi:BadF/BadG/BcrA/BcrD ATPase family protein [Nonomuraea sp. NEAU-A123]|uniref:N-acetylglucosamine kinase n=1 Tax=Nonomuraea sp. NEAU-A123 TaxID=2839649 RepID=UPI001BE3D51F|nr:BadF/BadG/BcrA/BcrD ATPase family protein [Nonomuraea sp. NEAU-A123]MBT2227493.1 ATPase [Nonomuraea sp. NEAU-A123]